MTKYVCISVEKHFINIMRTMGAVNTGEQHDRGLKHSNKPSDMKRFFSLQNCAEKTILMESVARYDNHMVRFYPQTQTFKQISPQFEQINKCFCLFTHHQLIKCRSRCDNREPTGAPNGNFRENICSEDD